jgi:hypothetical protein
MEKEELEEKQHNMWIIFKTQEYKLLTSMGVYDRGGIYLNTMDFSNFYIERCRSLLCWQL